jgi:hypothetical protein
MHLHETVVKIQFATKSKNLCLNVYMQTMINLYQVLLYQIKTNIHTHI